jgi:hypothetical protein
MPLYACTGLTLNVAPVHTQAAQCISNARQWPNRVPKVHAAKRGQDRPPLVLRVAVISVPFRMYSIGRCRKTGTISGFGPSSCYLVTTAHHSVRTDEAMRITATMSSVSAGLDVLANQAWNSTLIILLREGLENPEQPQADRFPNDENEIISTRWCRWGVSCAPLAWYSAMDS